MMPGVPERRTHSYVRHGTTSLLAPLDTASGFVIGKCYNRHRAAEFLDFLKQIDARVPEGLDIHIIMDNYATHKTAVIKTWLARRPHYHVHFTPTSASWINQSNDGSQSSHESSYAAASTPQQSTWRQISAPSSNGTMKIPNRIDGPNLQMKF